LFPEWKEGAAPITVVQAFWEASYFHMFGSVLTIWLTDNNKQVAGENLLTKKTVLKPLSTSSTPPTNGMIISGNVGIGTTTPKSKLQVAGAIQIADDTAAASADKEGAIRYRKDANNSYIEMCMQTGAATYEWKIIYQNNW
jgi:hypothetical protein